MKLLFATGGTAGHINPALAVASYIKEQHPDYEIMFIGTADHMESRLVPTQVSSLKQLILTALSVHFRQRLLSKM